jgi:orotate phosphoribosyltransferase
VTTAGTSVREVVPLLREQGHADVIGLVVGVDRQERGQGTESALEELGSEFGIQAVAIVTLDDVLQHVRASRPPSVPPLDADLEQRIASYRDRYGAGSGPRSQRP